MLDPRIILFIIMTLVFAVGILSTPKVTASSTLVEAAATVRKATNSKNPNVICSAVVIAPAKALTAKHCLTEGGIDKVGGQWVLYSQPSKNSDAAVLTVPGLSCPCATVALQAPVPDVTVVAFGYGGDGLRHLRGPGVVKGVGYPDLVGLSVYEQELRELGNWRRFIWFDPVLVPGDSGGGTFALRGGRWVLVGINAVLTEQPDCPAFACGFYAAGSVPLAEVEHLPKQ